MRVLKTGFQFHKGTIKTFCFRNVINSKFNFNSIKVRLKHLLNLQYSVTAYISIP